MSSEVSYDVFQRIGYEKTSVDELTLKTPVDEKQASVVGFELFLAHTQLYALKGIDYLSSKYPMKDVLEGWLNTTGNAVNILQWLAKNSWKTMEKSGIERNPSSVDAQGERMGSKSITAEVEPLHYDNNGDPISDKPVKYPPNEHHDYIENNSFLSLRAADYGDIELYGGQNDHAGSPRAGAESEADRLDKSAMYSKPLSFSNKVHECEQSRNRNQVATQEMRKDVLYDKNYVVARGINPGSENLYEKTTTGQGGYSGSEYENITTARGGYSGSEYENTTTARGGYSGSEYENITTARRGYSGSEYEYTATTQGECSGRENLYEERKKMERILAYRMAAGTKTSRQSPQDGNFAQDDYGTRREVHGERGKYEDEHKHTDGTVSDPGLKASFSCHTCGEPPVFRCEGCGTNFCNECFKRIEGPPCCGTYRFSSVV